jgi:hypothetical protein
MFDASGASAMPNPPDPRWTRLSALLDQVLELPPEARPGFLAATGPPGSVSFFVYEPFTPTAAPGLQAGAPRSGRIFATSGW